MKGIRDKLNILKTIAIYQLIIKRQLPANRTLLYNTSLAYIVDNIIQIKEITDQIQSAVGIAFEHFIPQIRY